jgi:hypothetical protein
MSYVAEQLAQQRVDDQLHQRAELRDFAERKGLITDPAVIDLLNRRAHVALERRFSGAPITELGGL